MKRNCLLIATLLVSNLLAGETPVKMTRDFVPDAQTAVAIAEAVLQPIYGNKIIKEQPFKATLSDDIWIVEGVLPKGVEGGVAMVKIRKSNSEILSVSHGK